ncbi:MAG: homoserine O-acetyltransferase [Fuerstiella sp.]|nr:homoserine O-acetyltransferase [Fuerstiella sp.]
MSARSQPKSAQTLSQSAEIVEKQTAILFSDPPLTLASGESIGPVTIEYETYGHLNEARDNAVFVCHALTGDAHAAGIHCQDDKKPGWWDGLIGPGCGLNTHEYFIICANVLGGCQGTTGPGSVNPQTGQRYCLDFPFLTVGDMVSVHSELVRSLGIDRLCGVIGGSLGGMQALDWSVRFPDQIASAIIVAAGHRLSAQGIAFNAVGRRAIYADPGFDKGNYDSENPPRFGLALARMIAHITYLSEDSIELKFGRRLQDSDKFAYDMPRETEFQIESYLHHQGKRFVQRFDANSYLYLTRAMDYFDLAESYGSLAAACRRATCRFLVISYDTDWLFPTSQSRELMTALMKVDKHVSFLELKCSFGHDSFLIDIDPLSELIGPFIDQASVAEREHVTNSHRTDIDSSTALD